VSRRATLLLIVLFLAVAGSFCVVILDERQQAFRTLLDQSEVTLLGIRLNEPVLTDPGLCLRVPGLHEFYRYEKRLLRYDSRPRNLYTVEKELIDVDFYALWRISEPEKFFKKLRTQDNAGRKLDDVILSALRRLLAQSALKDLLTPKRAEILKEVTRASAKALGEFGVELHDVRIRHTDYPDANRERIFDRMRTERDRFARKARAEGGEQARRVRSSADRDSQVVRAEALRESLRIRGEGDAEAARIYADSYGEDPEFYSFVRSLEAYRNSLDEQTTLILSPSSPFLKYLFDGAARPGGASTP
jgi:membrane protease subunit HflC